MESMPVAMYLDRKLAVNSKINIKARYPRAGRSSRFKYDTTSAPEEITAYTVAFNRKIQTDVRFNFQIQKQYIKNRRNFDKRILSLGRECQGMKS
jgi:hypothetical protein